MDKITDFRGYGDGFLANDYRLFSHKYPSHEYPTLEHAFQAAKTHSLSVKGDIRAAATAREAKRIGKSIPADKFRSDWDDKKESIMHSLLKEKFTNVALRVKLLCTRDSELVMENNVGDTFWGVSNGVGDNRLGKLIMTVRSDILKDYLDAFEVFACNFLSDCGWSLHNGSFWTPIWDDEERFDMHSAVAHQIKICNNAMSMTASGRFDEDDDDEGLDEEKDKDDFLSMFPPHTTCRPVNRVDDKALTDILIKTGSKLKDI
jgi:ribA/ribD-fused uncharacterized protein